MAIIILLIQFIVGVDTTNRLLALSRVIFYSILGITIYLTITLKNKLLINIFGQAVISSFLNRFKLIKKANK